MHDRRRIASLVPSWTEALFELGLGDRVCAITDWCVHPRAALDGVPRIGGTKDPDVDAIAGLAPDLVIANHEENTRRSVEALVARGLDVWVTYPRTVAEAVVEYEAMVGLAEPGPVRDAASQKTALVRSSFEAAAGQPWASSAAVPVFCPIWHDPWMAVGSETYAHDLLSLCGGANVFANHGDRRYPIVRLEDIEAAQPEVVLLPDEPYAFGEPEVREIAALPIPAARSGRIHCVDGTWISWYGPRIAPALEEIRRLLSPRSG